MFWEHLVFAALAPRSLYRRLLSRQWSYCFCCWSLSYSTILCSQADSLCLHVILHEWPAFYSAFLNIHQSGVLNGTDMTGATWNYCRLSMLYTILPCLMSLHAKPHTSCACVFRCNLSPALLAQWPGSSMCYCGNTGAEQIPKWVSTECWPWRRKFSCRYCRDLNPGPLNHKSNALTTELSLPAPLLHSLSPNALSSTAVVLAPTVTSAVALHADRWTELLDSLPPNTISINYGTKCYFL